MPGSRAPDCEYERPNCGRAFPKDREQELPDGYVLLIDHPGTDDNPLAFCSWQCLESMAIRQMQNAAKARRRGTAA